MAKRWAGTLLPALHLGMPSLLENHVSETVNLASSKSSSYEPPHRKSQEKSWVFGVRPIGTSTDGISKHDIADRARAEGTRRELAEGDLQMLRSFPSGTPRGSIDRLGQSNSKTDNNHSLPTLPNCVHGKDANIDGEPTNASKSVTIDRAPSMVDGVATQPMKPAPAPSNRRSQDGPSHRSGHARAHSSSAPQSFSSPIISDSTTDIAQGPARIGTDPPVHRKEIQSTNPLSSPPTLSQYSDTALNYSATPPHPGAVRLQHRHTLQVPRVSTGRSSRDFLRPMSSSSDNAPIEAERLSPTHPGRGSLSLGRRPTRSIHSDQHLDEVAQDDDMARWTETIRQKRASRRKRKDEEEDDRVVVGTKVDMNHVNWVTAYNMLTGIRFTVSRTNAKIDRALTDGDFDARHKFSFDM